ncbi:PREDICTED: mitochondrial import inner membrane translocase subunit TIM50-like isoform X2 [Tarenaya hassleriana]|uniref:mitochondrial import inner membrane translocase subunit TIM50-like isoform X2 n=1 Tax=Tarenaya hassleriana TaxID=28532 RepID=UPI00053C968F|nr:PREDICTED: mitochondrial import inner membrane translocase subunit TIM50-like isoform X2 [Tarenaya hassleriana]
MASIVLRSRFISRLAKFGSRNLRIFSSEAASSNSPVKEPGISAGQSIISDLPPPQPDAAAAAAAPVKERKLLKYLTYGVVSALTGVTAAAGYVTYAYSLNEVDEKAKAFRESVKREPADDASPIDYQAFLYSAAMAVPAKAIEMYLELRALVEEHVREFTEPLSEKLLPDLHPAEQHVFTLVLDLNETLLYTDWKRDRGWRTFKRPGVDAFLEHLAKYYEIVVYSDQMDMYVAPVCERLDPNQYIRYRLAKGATKYENGKHYRDLSKLNRDPKKILYVSGNAFETSLQPENCVPIKPYKLEQDDTALLDLIPFLEYVARNSPADIRTVLTSYERRDVAKEFRERSREYQRRMQEQRGQGRFWRR